LYNNNSTLRGVYSASLNVGDCLQYTDTDGFFVTDSSGAVKQSGGFQGPQGSGSGGGSNAYSLVVSSFRG
jgi:hypothetical protein